MISVQSFPIRVNQWFAIALFTLLSLIFFFAEAVLFEHYAYLHSEISNGQLWRLVTGHLFHANQNHLLMNLAGLWCLWALHGEYYTVKSNILLFLTSGLIVALGMYFFDPQIEIYVGLSGILHGFVAFGALCDFEKRIKLGFLLFVGLLAKVGYEQLFGASPDVVALIEMNVAINAHLFGVIGGVVFYLFYRK